MIAKESNLLIAADRDTVDEVGVARCIDMLATGSEYGRCMCDGGYPQLNGVIDLC